MRLKPCLLLLLLPNILWAQFKNIKLDEGTARNHVAEPSITINKKNPTNIVAASVPDKIYYTSDGGTTWQSTKLTSSSGVYKNPVLVSDDKGSVYSFHLSDPTGRSEE